MKTEIEIRAAHDCLSELLQASKDGYMIPAPAEAKYVMVGLDWLMETRPDELAVRQRKLVLLNAAKDLTEKKEQGALVMVADVLAWALDETDWPNYKRVDDAIISFRIAVQLVSARRRSRLN